MLAEYKYKDKKHNLLYNTLLLLTLENIFLVFIGMYLFIQAVSSEGKLIIFNEQREILFQRDTSLLLNESSKLISTVWGFLSDSGVWYDDIENIVVVYGPGSFTGIRTISLFVNTLAFIYGHIFLTSTTYFDLFDRYPICKVSSKRDLFVKTGENAIITIARNEDVADQYRGQKVYGDVVLEGIDVDSTIDYKSVIDKISLKKEKQIAPLYIKKPNIS